jgi:hypothetical protein
MSERIYVVIVKSGYKVNLKTKERSELTVKLREILTTLWRNTWHTMSSYHMFTNGVIAIAGKYFMTIETFDKDDALSEYLLRLKTNDLTYLNYAIEKIKEVVESGNTRKLRIVTINDDCGDLIEINMNIIRARGER